MLRSPRALLLPLLAALAAALVLPAGAAAARPVKLVGQVIAPPMSSGSKTLVDVLLNSGSVRAAHLKTALVVLSLPKRAKIALPGHPSLAPSALAWGDVFEARTVVSRKIARQTLPAIALKTLKLRSHGTPATDLALAQKVAALQQQLDALTTYVHQLAAFTYGALQSLRADLSSARADTTSLASTLAALQAQLGTVSGGSSLATQVGTLATQVSSLSTGLGTVTTGLSTVAGKLTGINPGDLVNALSAISALQTLTNGLDVAAINSQLTAITSHIGGLSGTDLQTQLNTISGLLTTLTGRVNVVCSPTANLLSNSVLGTLLGTTHFPGC